jgi:hypothetical protein
MDLGREVGVLCSGGAERNMAERGRGLIKGVALLVLEPLFCTASFAS